MDRFNSYSGNGYVERKSQELRSLNRQVTYNKEQQRLKKEMNIPKKEEPTVQQEVDKLQQLNPLPQNHLKFPGNTSFNKMGK